MRRALEYAKAFDLAIIDHCEEPTLAEQACMNEGPVSTVLGLRGQPAAGEAIMVERDVLLAELAGGRVHIAHLSAAASVDAVRRGKARGVRVTAEVTPHHLLPHRRGGARDRVRHQHEDEPAAALRGRTARRCSPGCSTARSTASPPTTPRTPWTTRRSSTTRRRTASSAWRRRWRSASTGWSGPGSSSCRTSWRCSRRTRRGCSACPAGRSPRARRRTSRSSTSRRSARWTRRGSRAAAATRPSAAGS